MMARYTENKKDIKIYKKMSDFFIDECPLPYHTM
jgi:hypothetical protein